MIGQITVAICAAYIQEGLMTNPDVDYMHLLDRFEFENMHIAKEVGCYAILCTEMLEDLMPLLSKYGCDNYSSFQYEVCHLFGGWLAEKFWFNLRHQAPSKAESVNKLKELIEEFMKIRDRKSRNLIQHIVSN
ncbi:hypothetical protein C2134_00560 [Chromobacterium sinusclupearum]|uniref:Uncharacterized protein n=1 Tax=Chromobacterium sinusclupearum TaxID=2077146 RepID=A0A2K4MU28_9NEIS|nr:hypothetical protein [Chromobacterium sinusclupearum]POB00594.1 hypothetical protein C2134_00560 [Chromobacterium sinusclupearum]